MQKRANVSLTASIVAGLGASACCLLPLLLVMAGFGGTWLASLKALEPFRPIFMAMAAIALFFAWRAIHRAGDDCESGQVCTQPRALLRRKRLFWTVATLVIALLTFPYYAVLLF